MGELMSEKTNFSIFVVGVCIGFQCLGVGSKSRFRLTPREQAELAVMLPLQKELMEWTLTPGKLILEKTLLLINTEAFMNDPKDEKDCEALVTKSSKELSSKVPIKILNDICRLNLFKKRNPRLYSEHLLNQDFNRSE